MRPNRRSTSTYLLAAMLLLPLVGFVVVNAQNRSVVQQTDERQIFKAPKQLPSTPVAAQVQRSVPARPRLLPGTTIPGTKVEARNPLAPAAAPVSSCTPNGPGFTCNIYETNASGNPSEISNIITLPATVLGGLLVLKENGAIADNVVANWSDVLKFGDGTNTNTNTMQLFSKGCNTGNPNDTSCLPAYDPANSGFVVEAHPGPTVFVGPGSSNIYKIYSVDDDAPARAWTVAGSTGQHDEDSASIVRYNSFGVNIANGQTGAVHMRYNITAEEGLSRLCPASLSVIRTRFRNSDNNGNTARLTYEIHRSNINSGGNTILYTFDSNGRGGGQAFKTAVETTPLDFDFSGNMYWIEATIFRSDSTEFSDLGSIQIWEAAGTPCP